MAKINERVSGIFDKWDVPDNYAEISESYARGTIKGDIRVKTKGVFSTARFTNERKKHVGLEVTIENERGEGAVYIPLKEIPSISELSDMGNSRVEYKSRTWSSDMEGTSVDTELKFLDGKFAGNVYKGNEFA